MSAQNVIPIPAFSDNYFWLIVEGGNAAVVDPGDAAPVRAKLAELGVKLTCILLTHHHPDHIGGVPALVAETGAPVIGHLEDAKRLPPLSRTVRDGERFMVPGLSLELEVIATPGHTVGHICYFGGGLLLAGDTLFSGGCGRMFEGTPQQFHASLSRLAALPADTRVCCAHEYTLSNFRFANSLLPDDAAVSVAYISTQARRAAQKITLPSTIGWERQHNIFLRCGEPAIARAVGAEGQAAEQVFARVRAAKDAF